MPLTLPEGTKFHPTQDSVFCRMYVQGPSWKPGSKLVIPKTSRGEVCYARIIEMGPGAMCDVSDEGDPICLPMLYEIGQDIVFFRYHGERINIGEASHIVLKQGDILGVIKLPEGEENTWFEPAGLHDLDGESMEMHRQV